MVISAAPAGFAEKYGMFHNVTFSKNADVFAFCHCGGLFGATVVDIRGSSVMSGQRLFEGARPRKTDMFVVFIIHSR